ncbi:MAG TPA: tetratricopeptide repeat protein, partial [Candidatus Limnocylindrales bacterium]|nr:tetratricopeptide repeat protein [Candidatus Limnocylindrales bacterium]
KCLEKEMEERFQSAKELALDLRRLTRDRGSGSASKEAPALASSHIVRRRATALAAVAVVVSLVLVAAIFWLARIRKASEAARIQPPMAASIAVLPFADLSPTHDHEYFCEGLAEEILNKLTKIPNLRVAARTSAFQFKRQNQDLRDIGQKLDVANILEGSVQREANRVRITVHLTKIDAGLSLWSENYDREFQDIFAVEDDIASAVTASLQPALLGRQTSVTLPPPQTANPEAYQAFLQARYFMRNSNLESEQKAFVYINKAIQFDPNYAPAYALRAVMTAEAGFNGRIVNVSTAIRESRRDAEKAISLDPNLPAAYLALSESQATGDWDWRAAQQSVRKARELAPGDADALLQSGFLTMCQGRLEEAAELMNQGLAIDPLAPGKHTMLAEILLYLGRYDAALQALEKAPFQNTTHEVRGEAYLAQGQAQDALVEMEKESEEAWRDFGMAMAYYALHRGKDSDAALTQLTAKYGQVAASQIAEAYAYRNERDQAFHWLERARLQHDSGLGRIKVNWLLKNLRNDPRFARLLQQVNLAE